MGHCKVEASVFESIVDYANFYVVTLQFHLNRFKQNESGFLTKYSIEKKKEKFRRRKRICISSKRYARHFRQTGERTMEKVRKWEYR